MSWPTIRGTKLLRQILKRGFLIAGLLFCAVCQDVHVVAAQTAPLNDLLNSKDLVEPVNKSGSQASLAEADAYWFEPNTEFASIFLEPYAVRKLNTWIMPSSAAYKTSAEFGQVYDEYAEATVVFSSFDIAPILSKVLVPHPRYVSMIPLGLISVFAQLEPKKIKFKSQKQVEVQGYKAALYELNPTACQLVVKLSRSAVLTLNQANCSKVSDLTDLAAVLDLPRLERKLNS